MPTARRFHLAPRLRELLVWVSLGAAVVLLGGLSARYRIQLDWTAQSRNTLSEASQALLERVEGPVTVTAYVSRDGALRQRVTRLVERYQRHKPDISLRLVDPDAVPEEARRLGVATEGELRIEFSGRAESVREPSEQALSNALNRVARAGQRWIAFITGHAERNLSGKANHDLGDWGRHLTERGFRLQPLTLTDVEEVPENTAALILADPQVSLLPREIAQIESFLDAGGNLLWLTEPDSEHAPASIASHLGLAFVPGTIVDPTSPLLGVNHPTVTVVSRYGPHPATAGFELVTLYPGAGAIDSRSPPGWESQSLLTTSERTWAETEPLAGEVTFNPRADRPGPLVVGVSLTRPLAQRAADTDREGGQQRIVVIGDGDFLSNAYLGNGGNLDLGLNLINWLSRDDSFIAIPTRTGPDRSLNLSRRAAIAIAFGSLFAMPLLLFGIGMTIWWRRRRL